MRAQKSMDGKPPKFIKSNWREFFVIRIVWRIIEQGGARPRFYLPVRRYHDFERNGTMFTECWFVLLAPLGALFYMFRSALLAFWHDVFDLVALWEDWSKLNKKEHRKPSAQQLERAIENTPIDDIP